MSFQWTLVAAFLYMEIAVVLLLVLPIIQPRRWQRFFKSRFLQAFSQQSSWYFGIIIFVLVLFFLDSIREIRKYNLPETKGDKAHVHLEDELQNHVRLFRAQRNFYISGFALFLSLVVRRLVSLISTQASLMAENEAILKQAKSADTVARSLMSQTGAGEAAQNSYNEAHQKEISKLTEEMEELKKELEKAIKDKEAIKAQAEGTSKEYDRLSEEHRKLVGAEANKKDD